jgi:hypothetical protein
MSTNLSAPPLQTQLIESVRDLTITKVWASWLRSLVDRAQVAAYAIASVALTAQVASIGLTSLVPVASGRYRVSYRFRVSTAAGTSSSVQFSVSTTEGGVVCTQSSAAYTGNLTSAPQSGSFVVHADPSTPLQYATTYASVGVPAAAYDLDVTVEAL